MVRDRGKPKKSPVVAKRFCVRQELSHQDFSSLLICDDQKTGQEVLLGTVDLADEKDLGELYPAGRCYNVNLDRPYELKVKYHFRHEDTGYVVLDKKKRYIGKYELLCQRDKGAMGVIYKVKDSSSSEIFALKEIGVSEDGDSQATKRILQESYILEKLNHRYILKVHDTLLWKGKTYILMDYVTGENLDDLIAKGPIPPKMALQCIKKVAEALAYLHKADIIHRDIKPANIMLDSKFDPKLMDFGIAKVLKLERRMGALENIDTSRADVNLIHVNLTLSGQMVGTPRYMAPELIKIFVNRKAEYTFDRRIDIFALGVTLTEMLLGEYPFSKTDSLSTLFWSIATAPTPQIPDAGERGNHAINRLIEKMMAKNQEERFSNMEEVVQGITYILQNFKLKTRWLQERGPDGEVNLAPEQKQRWRFGKLLKALLSLTFVTAAIGFIAKVYFPECIVSKWVDSLNALLTQFKIPW